MFPGANARVYRNEAGEPLGWDYPSDDEPDYDPYDNYEYDPEFDDDTYDRETDEKYHPEDEPWGPDSVVDDSWLDGEYESRFEIDEY